MKGIINICEFYPRRNFIDKTYKINVLAFGTSGLSPYALSHQNFLHPKFKLVLIDKHKLRNLAFYFQYKK